MLHSEGRSVGGLAVTLLVCLAIAVPFLPTVSMAQPADQGVNATPNVPWGEAFESISQSETSAGFILIAVSNDPWLPAEPKKPSVADQELVVADADHDDLVSGANEAEGESQVDLDATPGQWCRPLLNRSIRGVLQRTPSPRDSVRLQCCRAGLPPVLTGGSYRVKPEKLVLLICDSQYRLLNWIVGVPTTEQLDEAIQNAGEVRTIVSLNQTLVDANLDQQLEGDKLFREVFAMSHEAASRPWRQLMDTTLAELGERTSPAAQTRPNIEDESELDRRPEKRLLTRIGFLTDAFLENYLLDAQLRFGLTKATDRLRLRILEQHAETRQEWCSAMLPFFAGEDTRLFWRPLVESIWGQPTVYMPADQVAADEPDRAAASGTRDLLMWWDSLHQSEGIALSVKPAILMTRVVLPEADPIGNRRRGRTLTQADVRKSVSKLPLRSVTMDQLAVLIQQRELDPVDITSPDMVQFLVYPADRSKPVAIRASSDPGPTIARVKNVMK